MNTHRETILQAVVVRLATVLPGQVYRSRAQAFSRRELPAIVVKPGGERSQRIGKNVVERTFEVLFEVLARSVSEPGRELSADQVADPLIAAAHGVLFADKTLGNRLADLRDKETQEPQYADGDETAVGITVILEAVYPTTERDITKPTTNGAV